MELKTKLSTEFHLKEEHVLNIVQLLDDGNTVPFIARYRKEMTGHCDDQVLRELSDRLEYLRNLEKRKIKADIQLIPIGSIFEILKLLAPRQEG